MIPTAAELTARNIANLESKLGQSAPVPDTSFLRVLAATEALAEIGMYKFAAERILQVFALTATGVDLERIGAEYGVIRKVATAARITIALPAATGTVIPISVKFIADANGLYYTPLYSATSIAGVAAIPVICDITGTSGDLLVGDTLIIDTQIIGAESSATVDSLNVGGAELESQEVYRSRVLLAVRALGGGGNAYDYKRWAEEAAGVKRSFPYSGRPFGDLGASAPRHRTIYIESDTGDGVPAVAILDAARVSITTDPATGRARQPLGGTDETLFVEAISRISVFVQISGLITITGTEVAAKADISTALTTYFLSAVPFVDGVDAAVERNDLVTDLTVSAVVQDVLASYGGSAASVAFGLFVGDSLPEYRLPPGVLTKLDATNGVTYV